MAEQGVSRKGWLEVREAGSAFGIQLLLQLARRVGRWPVRLLLPFVVLYFALTRPRARRASRDYFARLGLRAGFAASYAHLLRFAQCAADRPLLIANRRDLFRIESHGNEHLRALRASGKGALLLGAHLGSFEAMHTQAENERLVINVVGYFRNARLINSALERLGGRLHARLIEPSGGVEFVLKLRDCLERGEFVAILGDRSMGGKAALVDFLGGKALFPTGPFALAALLRCPVLLTFGLHKPPNLYELHCEPFVEQVVLARQGREEALAGLVQRFAHRLEHYCALAPDNWFNFYDFWVERA